MASIDARASIPPLMSGDLRFDQLMNKLVNGEKVRASSYRSTISGKISGLDSANGPLGPQQRVFFN